MINKNLSQIWNSNIYSINESEHYIKVTSKNNKNIVIMDDYALDFIKNKTLKRKNCFVNNRKDKHMVYIYLTENYILSILRNRFINSLLND